MPPVSLATTVKFNRVRRVSVGRDHERRRTSAALELLEGFRGGKVARRAGGGDAGVGRVLEVHVGADAGEVEAVQAR